MKANKNFRLYRNLLIILYYLNFKLYAYIIHYISGSQLDVGVSYLKGYTKDLSIIIDIQLQKKYAYHVDIEILIKLCFLDNNGDIFICFYILKIVM